MLFRLLTRRLQKWWSKAPWLTLSLLLGALYITGYAVMLWQEPPGAPIRDLPTYTYFFIITVTTVGFGDVVPVTKIGRLMAGVIAMGGIGAAAVGLSSVFAPIVVKANDPSKEVDIERVDRVRVVCVRSIDVPMIVREIHNPGITRVLENLLSPEGQDLRSIQIPAGKSYNFGRLAHHFREKHGAILIGIRGVGSDATSPAILNPVFDAVAEGGMFLDYISRNPAKIDWESLEEILAPAKS